MAENMSPEEKRLVIELRKRTGKNTRTCLFCLRYKKGNFRKALELCSDESNSDNRPIEKPALTIVEWFVAWVYKK